MSVTSIDVPLTQLPVYHDWQVEDAIREAEESMQELPEAQRKRCVQHVRTLGAKILVDLYVTQRGNYVPHAECSRRVTPSIKDLQASAQQCRNEVLKRPEDFKPIELSKPPAVVRKPSHKLDKYETDHEDTSAPVKTIGIGKAVHEIERRVGKKAGSVTETILESIAHGAPEGSLHPIRDSVISGTVYTAMVGSVGVIASFPVYIGVSGAEGGAILGRSAEQSLDHISAAYDLEMSPPCIERHGEDHCPIPSYTEMMLASDLAETRALFQLLQLPAKAIHALHHQLVEVVASGCDHLGLTGENVVEKIRAFVRSEYGPGHLPMSPGV